MSVRQATRTNVAKSSSRPRPRSGGAPKPAISKPRAADEPLDEEAEPYAEDEDGAVGVVPHELADDDGKPALKEDPILDRRIIEGMLNDRKELLDELAKEGMTSAAVLRRAAELGLSEALLRQVKGVAADLAGERPGRRATPSSLGARTCLSCDRVFLSTGPGNRLCMRCRGGDAGLAQF